MCPFLLLLLAHLLPHLPCVGPQPSQTHPPHLTIWDFYSPWSLSDSSVCPYPSWGVKEFFETIGRWMEFPQYLHLAWPLANFFWVAPPFKDARRSPILGKTCKRRSVLKPDLCGITWLTQKESGIEEGGEGKKPKRFSSEGSFAFFWVKSALKCYKGNYKKNFTSIHYILWIGFYRKAINHLQVRVWLCIAGRFRVSGPSDPASCPGVCASFANELSLLTLANLLLPYWMILSISFLFSILCS